MFKKNHLRRLIDTNFRLLLLPLLISVTAHLAHAASPPGLDGLMAAGRYREAQAIVEAALSKRPQDVQMRFALGVIQVEAGKPDDAIATFKALIADQPQLPEPHNNLAAIFAERGQYEEAKASLQMALQTNPRYATAHKNLGDVYVKLASQAYRLALEGGDGNTDIPFKLSLLQSFFSIDNDAGRPKTEGAAPPKPSDMRSTEARHTPNPVSTDSASAITSPAGVALNNAAPSNSLKTGSQTGVEQRATAEYSDAASEIDEAIRMWALAWSRQDLNAYLGSYSPNFAPQRNQSRQAWEADRRARILGKNNIRVDISNLSVTPEGDKAKALFRQKYQSGALKIVSKKLLSLEKSGGRWLIVKEVSYDESNPS